MTYDYVKHAITDRFDSEAQFAGVELSVRLGRAMGGRFMGIMAATSVGLMFAGPGVGFMLDGGRALLAGAIMVVFGESLLALAVHFAVRRWSIETRGDGLWLCRRSFFASRRLLATADELRDVRAQISPLSLVERLSARSRMASSAYRPWTVAIVASGEPVVLPFRMRSEEACRLADVLRDAFADRKRRTADKSGYRG